MSSSLSRLLGTACLLHRVFGGMSFGIQSNDSDVASTFAAAMMYDRHIDRIYITGSSYGSFFDPSYYRASKLENRDCFVASLQLPTIYNQRGPLWLLKSSYGRENVSEACIAIHSFQRDNGMGFYLAGHSIGATGVLDALQGDSNSTASTDMTEHIYGQILDLSVAGKLVGGHLLASHAAQVPVAMKSTEDGSGDVIVLQIRSESGFPNSQYEEWIESQHTLQPNPDIRSLFLSENLLDGGYSSSVARLSPSNGVANGDTLSATLEMMWENQLKAATNVSKFVSDIYTFTDSTTLLSGFTISDTSINSFLTQMDSRTGEELDSLNFGPFFTQSNFRALSLCGPKTSRFAYVVGVNTVGGFEDGSSRPVLVKVDVQNLGVAWSVELQAFPDSDNSDAPASAHGIGCAVTDSDEHVFLAGTVKDGATVSGDGMTRAARSAGKDDIFTAKIDSSDGSVVWVKQMGTPYDDSLATGGGIVVDSSGNPIVLANTQGSFMREKNELGQGITNDVVVFSIDGESGEYYSAFTPDEEVSETAEEVTSATEAQQSIRTFIIKNGTNDIQNAITAMRPSVFNDLISPTSAPIMFEDHQNGLLVVIVVAITLFLVGFVGLFWVRRKKRYPSKIVIETSSPDVYFTESEDCMLDHESVDMDSHNFSSSWQAVTKFPHDRRFVSEDLLLQVEPGVDHYSTQVEGRQSSKENHCLSEQKSTDALEVEVMRLLSEWKSHRRDSEISRRDYV